MRGRLPRVTADLLSLTLLGVPLLALSACASIINGTTQEVGITSDPPGATVSVIARFDRYGQRVEPSDGISITAPGMLLLVRTDSYRLLVQKEGYLPQEVRVEHRYSWWAYLDVLPLLMDLMVINETTGGLYAFDDVQVRLPPEVKPPAGRE